MWKVGVIFISLKGVERKRRERMVLRIRVVSDFVLGDSVFIIFGDTYHYNT